MNTVTAVPFIAHYRNDLVCSEMEGQQCAMATTPLRGVQRVRPVPFKTGIDARGNEGQYEFGEITAEWTRTCSHDIQAN